ncbi:MAG: ABC transporter permease [Candidatus Binataceae bacterium]
MKLRRVMAIAGCEARQLRRDKMALIRSFGVPLTLLLLFGYGLSLDVEHIPFAAIDYDHSALSRAYLYTFAGNPTFDLKSADPSERRAEAMLRRGQVRLVLIIPPDFERTLYHGLPASVQLMVDGVYPYRAEVTRAYALAAHQRIATDVLAQLLRERSGRAPDLDLIELRTRYLFNETMRTTNSIVPGLLAVILMMTPALMTALAVVREKELGSIFNFLSAPATRAEFVLGKLVPYHCVGMFNAVFLGFLVVALFGVPFKGSIVLFLVGSAIYVAATGMIGLVVSSFVRSQLAAVIVTMIVTVVPSFLYSGLLIPVSSMSPEAQAVAHLLPGMYFNRIVMAAFLKDLPLSATGLDLAALTGFAAVLTGCAIALTPKRES